MARGGLFSTTSGVVLSVIAMAAFNNYRRGTLDEWLAAKFLGRAAPAGPGQQLIGSGFGLGSTVSAAGEAVSGAVDTVTSTASGEYESWGGATLDKSAMASFKAMKKAAEADGVSLVPGSTLRSRAQQIALRIAHGCGGANIFNRNCRGNPPTAVPGDSNHEIGMAIDFQNCKTRDTKAYKWLAANAGRFGWKNLPSEPWHWSTGARAGS